MGGKNTNTSEDVSTDQFHDTKYTSFGGVLYNLYIRLNNAFVSSSRPEDSYASLINHLEDMISPFIDQDYWDDLKELQEKSKKHLMESLGTKNEKVLKDENGKLLDYQYARARLRACNKLISRKFNFYPIRSDKDVVD